MDEKIKSSVGNGYNIGFNPTSPYSLGGTIQTSIPSVANEVNNFSAKIDEMDLSFTGDLEVIEDTTLDWVSLAKDCLEQLRTANNEEIEKLQNENGNGLLMRILPFVYYLKFSNFSEEEKTILINQASALTNAHEISQLGCKIYADYVTLLLEGVDKVKALDALKEIDYNKYYSNDSIKVYQRILKEDLKSLDIEQIRSSGYVVD